MNQIMPHTLRGKLLLWFASTITITFIVFGSLVGLIIWQVLHEQIDHHLHTVITEAEQILQSYPLTERNDFLRSTALQRGMTVTILGPEGNPIIQTNSPEIARLSEDVLQTLLQDTPPTTRTPVHFNINDIRFATLPVTLSEGQGLLAVGYSLLIVEQTFQKIIGIIVLMLLIVLGITVSGIQTLLNRYLQPVEHIAVKANEINHSRSLSLRVPENLETTELQSLSKSINQMLDRLEIFFKTEQEFFSNAAHTLKTPLAIVRSYIESSPATKDKRVTLSAIDQANETIQDLLLISRMNTSEKGRVTTFSLSKVLEELVEIITVLANEKGIQVNAAISPNMSIAASKQLVKRAISNVLHNAINYTPRGGHIEVRLTPDNHHALIEVIDTGIGIPKKDMEKIFDRFYRGTNTQGVRGSGLGLPIVKAIVETFHGSIDVTSKIEKGTHVCIKFPHAATRT